MYKSIQVHHLEAGEHVMYRGLECLQSGEYFMLTCDYFRPGSSQENIVYQTSLFLDLLTDVLADNELGEERQGFSTIEEAIANFWTDD